MTVAATMFVQRLRPGLGAVVVPAGMPVRGAVADKPSFGWRPAMARPASGRAGHRHRQGAPQGQQDGQQEHEPEARQFHGREDGRSSGVKVAV